MYFWIYCLRARRHRDRPSRLVLCLCLRRLLLWILSMVYDGEYFLLLEDIFYWVIVHITLNFQFLIKRNHAFINLFPLFNLCSLLTYKSQYVIPLFQNTETIHGNFRARVTVFTSAMKRTLNTFRLLILIGMLLLFYVLRV